MAKSRYKYRYKYRYRYKYKKKDRCKLEQANLFWMQARGQAISICFKWNVMKIEFQNSIRRSSFLCRLPDIKIARINPCLIQFRPPKDIDKFPELLS